MNYEQLKNSYLEKLEATKVALQELPKYEQFGIFSTDELNKLKSIKDRNEIYLNKLKKGEIEVAIVGMENTGKSTFANALIKLREAFPTGSSRCTFTSTKLQYGTENKAVVMFFTKDDFNSMFQEMLQKVKYPNSETIKFENLDISAYEKYFESLKSIDEATYKFYGGTINKDIKSILDGKSEILRFLNNSVMNFTKAQIENQELKKFITDKYIARTVKNIDLELSEFEDTKEMVLYDVPGFNSITEKHKIETRKSLNSADAIILIKNVMANSEITSEEQTMLNSYDEESGIALSEKLFVYGTQIDKANKKEDALHNAETLKTDLRKNLNVNLKRLFVGSPYAYMQQIGLEDGNDAIETLENWGMAESIISIEDMKISIKDFYKNEAFNNIQKQINKNITNLKDILENVIVENSDSKKLEELQFQDNGILLDFARDIKDKVKNDLEELNDRLKKDINENEYFSKSLIEQIDKIADVITPEELDKINLRKTDIRGEFATNEVNVSCREQLKPMILDKFVDLTVSIANEKAKEYFDKTIYGLMNIFEVDNNNIYKDEIEKKLIIFVKELTEKTSYNQTSYVYLIQRFSRDLLSVVIGSGKGTSTRRDRFLQGKKEFISLAIHSDDFENMNNIYSLKLIQQVLNITDIENVDFETSITNELTKINLGNLVKFSDFKEIIKFVVSKNIPLSIAIGIIEKQSQKFKNITDTTIPIISTKIKKALNDYLPDFIEDTPKKDELYSIFENIKPSTTKDELLVELNEDIEILKEILKTAVIQAINLELPFITSFIDQNKKIIESQKEIDRFIQVNFSKIKYQELGKSEEIKVQLQEKKRVIENIRKLLTEL